MSSINNDLVISLIATKVEGPERADEKEECQSGVTILYRILKLMLPASCKEVPVAVPEAKRSPVTEQFPGAMNGQLTAAIPHQEEVPKGVKCKAGDTAEARGLATLRPNQATS